MRELVGGKNTIGRTAAVLKKPHKAIFNLFYFLVKVTEFKVIEIVKFISGDAAA